MGIFLSNARVIGLPNFLRYPLGFASFSPLSIAGLKLWLDAADPTTLFQDAALSDADSAAVIQVTESGGLAVLNGATGTAGDASLVVNDATLGNITLTLKPAATGRLGPETGLSYDIQMLTVSGVQTLTAASASVVADVTRSVA